MIFKKRRGVVFLVVVVFAVFLCSSVYASIGISPAIYEVNFKPNLKQDFSFEILGDANMKFKIVAEGDLAQYTTLSAKRLNQPGKVTASLSLPNNIELPGVHTLYISAQQQSASNQGISLLGIVKGVIKVTVPYPDEYATVSLTATSANAGNPVNFKVKINNLGKNAISARTTIKIYDSHNRTISSLPLGTRSIESLQSAEFESELNTEGYAAGFYRAEAIVEYANKTASDEARFRLGELFINITSYSNNFLRDQLNRMDIGIESFWSDPIEGVYANVSILNYSINFQTPPSIVEGFQAAALTGYFDTTGIKENEFSAKITLFYKGKTTEKTVLLWFKKGPNYLLYGIIVLVALVVLLLLILFITKKIKEKKKGYGRKKEKRK